MLSLLSVGLLSTIAIAAPTPKSATPAAAPAPDSKMSAAHYLLLNAPDRRVRGADARMQSLLAEGLQRSRTFAALVNQINRSDVIVYIESVMTLPKGTMGRLAMMPMRGDVRYLRVQIRADLSRPEAIALIGHELQHAIEIAGADDVRDTAALVRLYERIGHASTGDHAYDTDAAQDTGRIVRRELTQG
jgi:hypothetical protein